MKYGYLFYKKPLIPDMPSRPVNLGDPIQSYAVKCLYREMGIEEADIIPVPRYDMKHYSGEECICIVNTCSSYEELAYDSHFLPPNHNIHASPFSLHINRRIPEDEREFYKSCADVGCRDAFTERMLKEMGINAYLTGCLTLTFPRRSKECEKNAKEIYLIDVPRDFMKKIPQEILDRSTKLSSIVRFPIRTKSNRMTDEEAYEYHRQGEERIKRLRDSAKLVITSRLHAAAPCLAMGIPVILTKHDERFGFIDGFLKSYTDWDTDCIDWNPEPVDIEKEKQQIKNVFFQRVKLEEQKLKLGRMWESKHTGRNAEYTPEARTALNCAHLHQQRELKYAVLGVVSSVSYAVQDIMSELYPDSTLVCGVDSYVKNDFFEKKVILPCEIEELDPQVILITAVPGAFAAVEPYLNGRKCVVLKGKKATFYNF